MGNSESQEHKVTDAQVEEFCKKCRPLDLLVFRGSDGISGIIRKLQKKETGSGIISHVEVVMTPEWCDKITKLTKKFDAFPEYEFTPHPRYLLSWGSELSGKLNDGVYDGETGGVTFGVQFRDLRELVKTYASRPGANVGLCRLKENPIEGISEDDAKVLKEKLSKAYDEYKEKIYPINILDILASLYPELRDLRKKMKSMFHKFFEKDSFMFCSEFAASLYKDLGVITDKTDGVEDGKVLDHENVIPVDFLGHDTDTNGIRERICEDPIWVRPLED